jgi:hypothetical protein
MYLNFLLNILWGNTIIRNALHQNVLDDSQFVMHGKRCNSAVWSKILYLDLLHQSLTPGIMTDYDATAAFDRVLHLLSVRTCHRLGMPHHACIYNLLQKMEFTLLTGFGESSTSFRNNEDPLHIEQVMLQGSSLAAPMYNITSDVS